MGYDVPISAGVESSGIKTGIGVLADPYAADSYPNFSGCSQTNFSGKTTVTIDPGDAMNAMKAPLLT